jgi:DNA helicase-2/ATP-dependent DNA helicase PcrA
MSFPSREQAEVIRHRGKPLIVVAGPGTGKTRTLVERMVSLLKEDPSREISFITFTRSSRHDTEGRIVESIGKSEFEKEDLLLPRVSTLHTYAKSLVHHYASFIRRSSDFSVLFEKRGENNLVVREVLEDLGLGLDPNYATLAIKHFRSNGNWLDNFPLPNEISHELISLFESMLTFYNTFDIEGIVSSACVILETSREKLPPVFLQVDEYQDLNPMDQRLIGLAAAHQESQVVVVGDDAQSIYKFRFANLNGIRDLWNSPLWDKCSFSDSQRLPAFILNAALDLIAREGYLGGHINRKPPDGRKIPTFQCTQSQIQIPTISKLIKGAMSVSATTEKPLNYKDFLVLCPTTVLVEKVANSLYSDFNIPSRKPITTSIPDDIWRIVLLLRMLNNHDPLAIRQWLPLLGFTDDEIRELRHLAMRNTSNFWEYCMSCTDNRMQRFQTDINHLIETSVDLPSFINSLSIFPNLLNQEPFIDCIKPLVDKSGNSLPSFSQIIHCIYLSFGIFDPIENITDENSVLVATLHSAKGLEAENVICPWMNRTFLPLPDRDLAEQRRVLYVALTRAKQMLTLMFYEEFDTTSNKRIYQKSMCPFLTEIITHLQISRVRAEDVR